MGNAFGTAGSCIETSSSVADGAIWMAGRGISAWDRVKLANANERGSPRGSKS